MSGAELGQVTTTLPAWDLFAFLVANAPTLARVALGTVYEAVLELWDHVRSVRAGRPGGAEIPFLFERVVSNTVMREMTTAAVSVDVHRGVPVVWANFPAYDVMAHHRGPTSLHAFWTLRGIDRCVRVIERAARQSAARDYDLFVLSDHGMVPTVPFESVHGLDIHSWLVREGVRAARTVGGGRKAPDILPSAQLLGVLRRLRLALPAPLARLSAAVERRLERRIRRWELRHEGSRVLSGAETSIHYCGGMAHVYLAPVGAPLFRDGVEAAWPGLVEAIASLDGVRAVVVRARGGGIEATGPAGRFVARDGGEGGGGVFVEGESPLEGVVSEREALQELLRLLANPDSGDLVVLAGRLDSRGRGRGRRKLYLNFQRQSGAHGGVEPQEQYAFVMGPEEKSAEVEGTRTPEDLYALLRAYHD
ncbi:MAG: alkaline phosphatase family protein [Planctomycetota bacterium]